MRNRTLKFGFVAALAGILALGACTKKDVDSVPTLNVPIIANVKGLDPVQTNDLYSAMVVQQIYEPLFQYHYLKRPLVLEPLLAQAMPEISKDGLTHTIKIKQGVHFQDSNVFPDGKGREVTAQDFIYSWKRLADPKNESEGFWIFDGKVKGFNAWREKIQKGEVTYDTPIEGFQAPDKYTIVIKLDRPYFQLEYVLATQFSAVVAKEAVDKYGKEFINNAVGTGPFMLENWVRNSKVQLRKNPTWHGETYPTEGESTDAANGLLKDAGKPVPFVDKLVFHELTENQPRWLNFMKGNLDFIIIPKDNFSSAVSGSGVTPEMAKKGIVLSIVNELDLTYISFNMEDPVLGKNLDLRKALVYAIDEEAFRKKFYNGLALNAQGVIPPDVEGYDPNYKNPYKEYNVEKAKEFLSKAGYPGGKGLPTLEFSTLSTSTYRQMAEFYQQAWSAIGVQTKIVTSSWPQFLDKLRNRKAQFWDIAWMGDYPDAENFFQLLYSKNISPGSNQTNYVNKEFDTLYDQAALLPPGQARSNIYHQMRDVLNADVPWILGEHRQGVYLHQGWLENFKMNNTIQTMYKYMRVDTKKKEELKANF